MSEFEWIVPFKGSTRVSADSVATVACRGHKKGSKSEQLHIVLFPSLLQQLQWEMGVSLKLGIARDRDRIALVPAGEDEVGYKLRPLAKNSSYALVTGRAPEWLSSFRAKHVTLDDVRGSAEGIVINVPWLNEHANDIDVVLVDADGMPDEAVDAA
jgi:hypothetical protein